MAKEIGVITGWRRLQKMGRNVRGKRDDLKGKIIALDEAYLRVGGRKMWGLMAKNLEGVPKIKIFKMFDKNGKIATMLKKHNKDLTDKIISCNMIKIFDILF